MLIQTDASAIRYRLAAEIDEACPGLPLNGAWMKAHDVGLSVALAAELDHRAVSQDQSDLRSLADCVRLLGLPVPRDDTHLDDHRRVSKALLHALRGLPSDTDVKLLASVEAFCFGWAALPACTNMLSRSVYSTAAANATLLGAKTAQHRIAAAEEAVWDLVNEREQKSKGKAASGIATANQKNTADPGRATSDVESAVPEGHVVVCAIPSEQMTNVKSREVIGPFKRVINAAIPLVSVSPLHEVRKTLMFEFPYAEAVIDVALADLVGRTTVTLRPLLLVGDPGGGKSRFARRLAEVLRVHCWRTDASRSDGAVFGGTDKRWYSAEPCHPFLAIAQAAHANPLVLLDEIEKAGTRADYGRLWDCILGFLEPETNIRYPDPALQTELNLSHVSYIATANSLDALLPDVIADLAKERGLDNRWTPPLDNGERNAAARHWRGGSVRRLRRVVEILLRQRDAMAVKN